MNDCNSDMEITLGEVRYELATALVAYSKFNSAHEGYAVILEELDELWDEIKKRPNAVSKERMRRKARHVAAMAIRFMLELT